MMMLAKFEYAEVSWFAQLGWLLLPVLAITLTALVLFRLLRRDNPT